MNGCRIFLVLTVLAASVVPAPAGIFFNRKPKPNPAERVPALILTLKTDASEKKRAAAAEELRNFDAQAHPEIVPALTEAALQDPQVGVRLEAVQSLGKLRPISQQAGWALEQALERDPSMRVQWQARSVLLQYRLSGYRSGKNTEPPTSVRVKTQEPPLAMTPEEIAIPPSAKKPSRAPSGTPVSVEKKRVPVTPARTAETSKLKPVTTTEKPKVEPMEEGPELVMPK